jgi:hypothetical protein
MTVKELIDKLSEYDENMEVYIPVDSFSEGFIDIAYNIDTVRKDDKDAIQIW